MTTQDNPCLAEALRHWANGRRVVLCHGPGELITRYDRATKRDFKEPAKGKEPFGLRWHKRWRHNWQIENHFREHPNANLGLLLGHGLLDIEHDNEREAFVFKELFSGVEVPRTPCFQSSRGWHYFFRGHEALSAFGQAVVYYHGLGIRVGVGGAAQSVIPPSQNADGTRRVWTVSFDDCKAAELPQAVVDRIVAYMNSKRPKPTTKPQAPVSGSIGRAVAAMLALDMQDSTDGSMRLFVYACRAVEMGLSDDDAVAAINQAAESKPFLRPWTDAEILKRIRDAEKKTVRASAALPSIWNNDGRDDAANARRFVAKFGHLIRYCDSQRKWYVWDGQRWREDVSREIERLAKEYARGLYDEFFAGDRENKATYNFVRQTNSAKGIANFIALARSEPGIPIRADQLDTDPFLFNVLNGTIDLRTGTLRSHAKEDYCTKLAPVTFDPAATCGTWLKFLAEIFDNDQELVAYLQRLGGYCLTGDVREQILLVMHGDGSNGKSTLLQALVAVCGEYAIQAPPGLLLEARSAQHPTDRASLNGKRLAVASETGSDGQLDEQKVKSLTGGDKVSARKMHQDFVDFNASHKIVLQTNHKPQIKGTDHGIWRRIRLIPFDVIIPDGQQDKGLSDKLKAEYPGILNWLVEGCLAWQKQGLGLPARVREATAQYRASEDMLAEFLNAMCEQDPDATVGSIDLVKAYREYSGAWMSAKQLAPLLHARGFQPAKTAQRNVWRGLRLVG